jgi:hypothetical protein
MDLNICIVVILRYHFFGLVLRIHKNYFRGQDMRVLLDSGSDGDIIFVNKDKPMLLPSLIGGAIKNLANFFLA